MDREQTEHGGPSVPTISTTVGSRVVLAEGWRPIETAPKDGTWILAYRPQSGFGQMDTLVFVRWNDESEAFVWPDRPYDPYDPPDLEARDEDGFFETEVYEDTDFTHWMPLPDPPA